MNSDKSNDETTGSGSFQTYDRNYIVFPPGVCGDELDVFEYGNMNNPRGCIDVDADFMTSRVKACNGDEEHMFASEEIDYKKDVAFLINRQITCQMMGCEEASLNTISYIVDCNDDEANIIDKERALDILSKKHPGLEIPMTNNSITYFCDPYQGPNGPEYGLVVHGMPCRRAISNDFNTLSQDDKDIDNDLFRGAPSNSDENVLDGPITFVPENMSTGSVEYVYEPHMDDDIGIRRRLLSVPIDGNHIDNQAYDGTIQQNPWDGLSIGAFIGVVCFASMILVGVGIGTGYICTWMFKKKNKKPVTGSVG